MAKSNKSVTNSKGKDSYEVIVSQKEGKQWYSTEYISAFNLKTAEKKAEKKFSEKYHIHDVHLKA